MGVHLHISNLHRSFQKGGSEIRVLNGANLELASGESVALLGQSGSGKSTFLQIVGGLEPPSQGEVKVDGKAIHQLQPAALDRFRNKTVGFIFQFHHLLPDHSAIDNVAMPALIGRMALREARERAVEMLIKVGLKHRLSHKPGELSGGEQQRVAIARALILSPGLLLADEPTGNLDPGTAAEVFALLMSLVDAASGKGPTLILVTHSLELAAQLPRQVRLVQGTFLGAEA
jgi:lipoprotein-releasing system ATP-binding protein